MIINRAGDDDEFGKSGERRVAWVGSHKEGDQGTQGELAAVQLKENFACTLHSSAHIRGWAE